MSAFPFLDKIKEQGFTNVYVENLLPSSAAFAVSFDQTESKATFLWFLDGEVYSAPLFLSKTVAQFSRNIHAQSKMAGDYVCLVDRSDTTRSEKRIHVRLLQTELNPVPRISILINSNGPFTYHYATSGFYGKDEQEKKEAKEEAKSGVLVEYLAERHIDEDVYMSPDLKWALLPSSDVSQLDKAPKGGIIVFTIRNGKVARYVYNPSAKVDTDSKPAPKFGSWLRSADKNIKYLSHPLYADHSSGTEGVVIEMWHNDSYGGGPFSLVFSKEEYTS